MPVVQIRHFRVTGKLHAIFVQQVRPQLESEEAQAKAREHFLEMTTALNAGVDAGGFVMTPTAERIIKAFDRARESRGGVAHPGKEETQELPVVNAK